MLDFLLISVRSTKNGLEVYPKFIMKKSSDLMVRGGDFYAIWIEDKKLWSRDEQDAILLIDAELDAYVKEHSTSLVGARVLHMWDAESGMIDRWHKYCQKQLRDSFVTLDERLIFSNEETRKEDYASRKLPYPLEPGDISAYDKLMSTLYSPAERHKLEWAIGSVVTGDSKTIQKFIVLYGEVGSGKSTVIKIIQQLFEGYYTSFEAKTLGMSSNAFALEAFRSNPLVAIQHDGDLSRIEDNTRLNSLVSHEMMTVNEKFKSTYTSQFKCFLFIGTNKPVKITDAKSGLIRRLIDVSPSGNKLPPKEYALTTKQIGFELGAIAAHCRDVYMENPNYYDNYTPLAMLSASNDFYNFMQEMYFIFEKDDGVALEAAWQMYEKYVEDARVPYPMNRRLFAEELKSYFSKVEPRGTASDGTRVRSWYSGFRKDKFELAKPELSEEAKTYIIDFSTSESIFDRMCADCPAQYANDEEKPTQGWDYVKTRLSDLDTSKIHYVRIPENHIVIDFDIPDESGNKCFEKNLEAASKWPPTYAELSKSGAGIHLHYIYTGDIDKLARLYEEHIEIKTFTGKSSLRRKLTKCNSLPIATISAGLPLREERGNNKVIDFNTVSGEKAIRTMIKKNLNKEYHPATKPSVDYIYKILEDAYNSGAHYDVSNMRNGVLAFAANSTNNAEYCIKLVNKMHFTSADTADSVSVGQSDDIEDRIVFFDCEIFPGDANNPALFLVNWKRRGEGRQIVRMINPSSKDISALMEFPLVGFNNRKYDNHMIYGCMLGMSPQKLYELSQKIIGGDREAFFGNAYNVSYTDIHDFCSTKQSLKKWEIELGIHHQELGLPWDQPVPRDMWIKVSEYCDNDVLATEALFNARQEDFTARKILAKVADMTVNDTTNNLSQRIIFGRERNPQSKFNYRNLAEPTDYAYLRWYNWCTENGVDHDFVAWDGTKSLMPCFPGYVVEGGKSLYRDFEVGNGGFVYAEPGMYGNVALIDVESMHPSTIDREDLFGEYTGRFWEIVEARLAIKHGNFEKAKTLLNGALAEFISDEDGADALSYALKIVINSVYGQTYSTYECAFHDPRNTDNIVAKRGALFMVDLLYEVQARGFKVIHIKTDSIKVADATPEIVQFIKDFGKRYGYNFDHEATYDRMCLVNKSVYIAKYKDADWCKETYGYIPKDNRKHPGEWTATGEQFQVPYVFKSLFSHEPIGLGDMCETNSTATSLHLDMNENLPEGEHDYKFVGRVGQFCPIKPGCGGGELVRTARSKDDGKTKYVSVGGAKGYRWLETEVVRQEDCLDDIDRSYYELFVTNAINDISQYGDFNWFVSDDPYVPPVYHDGKPIYADSCPFNEDEEALPFN